MRTTQAFWTTVAEENYRIVEAWNAKGFGKVPCNVSEALSQTTSVKTATDPSVFTLGEPGIFSHPFLFMAGHYESFL